MSGARAGARHTIVQTKTRQLGRVDKAYERRVRRWRHAFVELPLGRNGVLVAVEV